MSSRLWLAVAFVLASGASPARAETSMIAVILDQAKIARLPEATATLIVGNPMIADVTMLKNGNTKSFRSDLTNFAALHFCS
jgi:Flp pilus assembly secretin CpaC